jgi:hypothetical protein
VGNPHVAAYWTNAYRNVWQGRVDDLLVLVNGDGSAAPTFEAVGAKVAVMHGRMGHGEALRVLVDACEADVVMLVEEDAWVRDGEAITARLDDVAATGAVIGCPRGGMDPAIAEAATAKWGEVKGDRGSDGHGLWPCFLFARSDDLRRCQTFASTTWYAGDTVPGLGWTVPADMMTDTMTAAAFELRERDLIRVDECANYKEMWQKECTGDEPWLHAGGLSNELVSRSDIGMDNLEGQDWAHRIWWLRRMGVDAARLDAFCEHAAIDDRWWDGRLEPWVTWE